MNSILIDSSISLTEDRMWPGKFCRWGLSWVLEGGRMEAWLMKVG